MKKIAILTSGGDAPGMNACIRAVTRYAIFNGLEVMGVERGYEGLVYDNFVAMNKRSVSDIIQRGGTFLKTARCPEFAEVKFQQQAVDNLKKHNCDALIVIGGNGSIRGCYDLYKNCGFNAVGIPGTIDNDLDYTDFTLGFDTAVNTVLSAINNLRDTMTSHDRVSIIEVMGRKCGDIALYAGIAGGAEIILVPEVKLNLSKVCEKLKKNQKNGKTSDIIVLSEGVCSAEELKAALQCEMGISLRTTTLGHIQRGGTPSMQDRLLAARFGVEAVDVLLAGKSSRVVGIRNNKIIEEDISEALAKPHKFDNRLYKEANILSL
ncbi:MAG: 6-phosphofructokinase [Clostridia bacterium]